MSYRSDLIHTSQLTHLTEQFLCHIQRLMKRTMDTAYHLLGGIEDDGSTCKLLHASDEDKKACEFQRFAAILMFLKTFKLPADREKSLGPYKTINAVNLSSVHAATKLMETRACGIVHAGCAGEISEFVRKLGKALDSIEDIKSDLDKIFEEHP